MFDPKMGGDRAASGADHQKRPRKRSVDLTAFDLPLDVLSSVVSFLLPPSDFGSLGLTLESRRFPEYQFEPDDGMCSRRNADANDSADVDLAKALPAWPLYEALRLEHQKLILQKKQNTEKTEQGDLSSKKIGSIERILLSLCSLLSAQEMSHCGLELCLWLAQYAQPSFAFERANPDCFCVGERMWWFGAPADGVEVLPPEQLPPNFTVDGVPSEVVSDMNSRKGVCCALNFEKPGCLRGGHVRALQDIPMIPITRWPEIGAASGHFVREADNLFWATFTWRCEKAIQAAALVTEPGENDSSTNSIRAEHALIRRIFLATFTCRSIEMWPREPRAANVIRMFLRDLFGAECSENDLMLTSSPEVIMKLLNADSGGFGVAAGTALSAVDFQELVALGEHCRIRGFQEIYNSQKYQSLVRTRILENFTDLGDQEMSCLLQRRSDKPCSVLDATTFHTIVPDRVFWVELMGRLLPDFYKDHVEGTLQAFNAGLPAGEIPNDLNRGTPEEVRENLYYIEQGTIVLTHFLKCGFFPTEDDQKTFVLKSVLQAFLKMSTAEWSWKLGNWENGLVEEVVVMLHCLDDLMGCLTLRGFAAEAAAALMNGNYTLMFPAFGLIQSQGSLARCLANKACMILRHPGVQFPGMDNPFNTPRFVEVKEECSRLRPFLQPPAEGQDSPSFLFRLVTDQNRQDLVALLDWLDAEYLRWEQDSDNFVLRPQTLILSA